MIRIIAGMYKGRNLETPSGYEARPVMSKVREAFFTMLGNVSGLSMLDLFAGTGAMGIEALSRGASRAVFVEADAGRAELVRSNLALADADGEVVQAHAMQALGTLEGRGCRFDIIFADPPYDAGMGDELLGRIAESELLRGPALFAMTIRHSDTLPERKGLLEQVRNRTYGDTRLLVYAVGGRSDE